MSEDQPLRVERRGGAAILTIDRAERMNSLSRGLLTAFGRAGRELANDQSVRLIVLGTIKARKNRRDRNPMRFSKTPETVPRSPSMRKTLSIPIARLPTTSVARRTPAERGRPRDHEQLRTVMLGLGRVALAQRVLDRERVQPVLDAEPFHLLGGRLDQPDPVELRPRRRGAVGRQVAIDHFAIAVAPGGDDRHGAHR